jgi:hypothetical protein
LHRLALDFGKVRVLERLRSRNGHSLMYARPAPGYPVWHPAPRRRC